MRPRFNKQSHLRGLLQVIHLGVKRCRWKVSWDVPYGSFTLSKTQEFLDTVGASKGTTNLASVSHYIAYLVDKIER